MMLRAILLIMSLAVFSGAAGQWVWSGYSFRLVEFSVWPDCDNGRSGDDWTVIYKRQAK